MFFFVPCDNLKMLFFSESLSVLWDFFNGHIVVFFETSVLKEVRILRYPYNNSAVLILILSSEIKLPYTILLQTWKTFVADFFMITFYTFFILWLFDTFFINAEFFFWKLNTSLKPCFYIILQNFCKSPVIYKRWVIIFIYKRWVFI